MDEFRRLCDEHGISKYCNCDDCWQESRHYPTLSELLDMVEEKWPGFGYKFYPAIDSKPHEFEVHETMRLCAAYGSGDTRELAVLKALIQCDEDESSS